ncbi:hypothetical protein MTO96_049389 [Rhipicephalus appendiculatus]
MTNAIIMTTAAAFVVEEPGSVAPCNSEKSDASNSSSSKLLVTHRRYCHFSNGHCIRRPQSRTKTLLLKLAPLLASGHSGRCPSRTRLKMAQVSRKELRKRKSKSKRKRLLGILNNDGGSSDEGNTEKKCSRCASKIARLERRIKSLQEKLADERDRNRELLNRVIGGMGEMQESFASLKEVWLNDQRRRVETVSKQMGALSPVPVSPSEAPCFSPFRGLIEENDQAETAMAVTGPAEIPLADGVMIDKAKWEHLLEQPKDSLFVKDTAKAIWGIQCLYNRSITGTPCRRFLHKEGGPVCSRK